MSAAEDDDAAQLVRGAGVDLVLVCRIGGFYQQTGVIDTFHGRLLNQNIPAWLEPVTLPEGLVTSFALFRVQR